MRSETQGIGPRSGVFRGVIRPMYAGARSVAFRTIDGLLGVRTTQATSGNGAKSLDERPPNVSWGWLSLVRLLRRHPLGPTDVFVDIGSGTGRVALAASWMFRCRRVIAVERDPRLHARAVENLRTCRATPRTPIELVHADALTWDLPADATTIFFFNSFRGKEFQELVERMLESLDRSPRSVQFLYANPVEAEFLARSPRFELIDVVRSWRPRADWTRTTSVSVYRVR